jgi:hypothetical protein
MYFSGYSCSRLSLERAAACEKQFVKRINMNNKNIGSSFDDFLSENAMLDEATAVAVKRVIAWQIEHEMKAQNLQGHTGQHSEG